MAPLRVTRGGAFFLERRPSWRRPEGLETIGAMVPASWRYDPAVSRRDLRLDFLRGVCLAKMVFNHLWKTPAHALQPWLGYVTAAEGFFLVSGTVVGIVHGRRVHERGLGATGRSVLQRSLNLYLANLAFVFLFLALEVTGVVPNDFFGFGRSFSWWQPFQLNQPYYLQVLPRYVAFLAAAPLALWCLTTRRTPWLLAAAAGLWLAYLAHGGLLVPGLEPRRHLDFPLLAWQLLFFVGMALGYHHRRLGSWWRRLPGKTTASALLAISVLFALALLVTDRFWQPLRRSAGPVLLPFGQASLYLFLLHIPVVWLGRSGVPVLSALSPHWGLLLVDAAVMALLWLAIRRRFQFGFVPS